MDSYLASRSNVFKVHPFAPLANGFFVCFYSYIRSRVVNMRTDFLFAFIPISGSIIIDRDGNRIGLLLFIIMLGTGGNHEFGREILKVSKEI